MKKKNDSNTLNLLNEKMLNGNNDNLVDRNQDNQITSDQIILTAEQILTKYIKAFKELAK